MSKMIAARVGSLMSVVVVAGLTGCAGSAVAPASGAGISVVVQPQGAQVAPLGSVAFSAVVTGTADTAVTWSVQEAPAGGSVTAAGLYTAPANTGTYHVEATSRADPTKSAVAAVSVTAGGGGTGLWVTGYYSYWQTYLYPLNKVDWSAITHITAANISPNADGSLWLPNTDGTGTNRWAVDIVNAAHAAGRKAILMVGGAGTSLEWQGATADANRAKFIQNLINFALKPQSQGGCGFDGLDLDWEPFNGSGADASLMLKLVQDLRAAWPGLIITWPVGMNEASPIHGTIAPLVDQLNIMQYGMSGAWPGWVSWHESALYGDGPDHPTSVDSDVRWFMQNGVPASKIGLGLGFYASVWTGGNPPVTGPLQPINGAYCDGYNDNLYTYKYVMDNFYPVGTYQWDPVARAGSISCPSGCGPTRATWISYETEQSILEKGAYARAQGLGGTIIWTLEEGCTNPVTGANPLLAAVKQGFLQ